METKGHEMVLITLETAKKPQEGLSISRIARRTRMGVKNAQKVLEDLEKVGIVERVEGLSSPLNIFRVGKYPPKVTQPISEVLRSLKNVSGANSAVLHGKTLNVVGVQEMIADGFAKPIEIWNSESSMSTTGIILTPPGRALVSYYRRRLRT